MEEKAIWVFISLSPGETLKCNRCGGYITNQRINLNIARDEAVIEVVCKKCWEEEANK